MLQISTVPYLLSISRELEVYWGNSLLCSLIGVLPVFFKDNFFVFTAFTLDLLTHQISVNALGVILLDLIFSTFIDVCCISFFPVYTVH